MHVEAIRDATLDLVEEFAELLRAMARHTGADHGASLIFARSDETREKRRRAMAVVVVRVPLALSGTHRQHWLRSIQSLGLALFVDADDQRLLRRIKIEADYVAHLLNELRIG